MCEPSCEGSLHCQLSQTKQHYSKKFNQINFSECWWDFISNFSCYNQIDFRADSYQVSECLYGFRAIRKFISKFVLIFSCKTIQDTTVSKTLLFHNMEFPWDMKNTDRLFILFQDPVTKERAEQVTDEKLR